MEATDSAARLLEISDAIERCAAITADAIVDTSPGLDRSRIKRAVSHELWMATKDLSWLARSGALC